MCHLHSKLVQDTAYIYQKAADSAHTQTSSYHNSSAQCKATQTLCLTCQNRLSVLFLGPNNTMIQQSAMVQGVYGHKWNANLATVQGFMVGNGMQTLQWCKGFMVTNGMQTLAAA